MRLFLDKYKDDVIIAEIPLMPETSLTLREYGRVERLINERLESENLWKRFVAGDLTLNVAQRQKVNDVGVEWLGQLHWEQF